MRRLLSGQRFPRFLSAEAGRAEKAAAGTYPAAPDKLYASQIGYHPHGATHVNDTGQHGGGDEALH